MKKLNVLVLGGAGYIGSHVCRQLIDDGHNVTIYDNMSTGNYDNVIPEITTDNFIQTDILNENNLSITFSIGKFDAIMHFAALKAAGDSMKDPMIYSNVNLQGTINVLNAAVDYNVKYIIFSSSASVYGMPQYLPIDENHPKNPINFYGFTKLKIEELLEWYSKLKGIKYAALRYFNAAGFDPEGKVTGIERKTENLFPIVMETALGEREKMLIFGSDCDTKDGTCIRDYVHVSDLAKAHVSSLEYLVLKNENLVINLGTENGFTVQEIIDEARKITGKPIKTELVDRRDGDPDAIVADSNLAKELINWNPQYSDIDTMIKTTWNVYKENGK